MLVQGKFLISFDVQGIGFCEELIIAYRTEELTPYLRYPAVKLNPNHLHVAGQEMTNTDISMTITRKNTQSITKN